MPGSRRTQEQWESLVSGWQRSSLSRRAYCERHGVSSGSLRRWEDFFAQQDAGELTAPPEVSEQQTTVADRAVQAPINGALTGLADLAEKARELSRQLGSTNARSALTPTWPVSVEPAESSAHVPPVEPKTVPLIQLKASPASTAHRAETRLTDTVGAATVPSPQPPALPSDPLASNAPPLDVLAKGVEVRALSAPAQMQRSGSGPSRGPVVVSGESVKDAPTAAAHPPRRMGVKPKNTRPADAPIRGSSPPGRPQTNAYNSTATPATGKATEASAAQQPAVVAESSLTREQWRALSGGWLLSGLSQKAYCERHGISVESLRHWRDVFEQERSAQQKAKKSKAAKSGAPASATVVASESPDASRPDASRPEAVAARRPDTLPAIAKVDAPKIALPPAASAPPQGPPPKAATERPKQAKAVPKASAKVKLPPSADPPVNGHATAVLELAQQAANNPTKARPAPVAAPESTPSAQAKSGAIRSRAIIPDAPSAPVPRRAARLAPKPAPVRSPAKVAAKAAEPTLTREQWRALAGGWLLSGMSQGDYCAKHGISVESLRHWREVFALERTGAVRRAQPKPASSASQETSGATAEPADQILPVVVQSETPDATPADDTDRASMGPVQPEAVTEAPQTREQWRAIAADWMLSGLTQSDYCERQGISLEDFRHWWESFARESSAPSTPAQRIREKVGSSASSIGPALQPIEPSEGTAVEVAPLETLPANPVNALTEPVAPAEPLRQVTLHLTPAESIAPMDSAAVAAEQVAAVEPSAPESLPATSIREDWWREDSNESANQTQTVAQEPLSLNLSDVSTSGSELIAGADWAESAPSSPPISDTAARNPIRFPDRAPEQSSDQKAKAGFGQALGQRLDIVKGWMRRVLSRTVERVAAVAVPRQPVETGPQAPAQAYQSGSASATAEGSPIYTHTRRITLDPEYLRDHRVITDFGFGEAAQSYKILRTQVLQRARSNGWRTLGVTATRQGHGKTLTALNLAISLANEVNQTVLLADLDLRRPSLAGYLCAEKLNGISDYLIGRYDISDILINPGIKRLVILPGNEPLINSSEQLSSPRMVQLVEELKSRYPDRIVLFDLPPLLMGDDVMAFAPNLDAMLLVLEEGKTTREELRRAYELLEGQNILGTVLNKSVYNLGAPGYGGESY